MVLSRGIVDDLMPEFVRFVDLGLDKGVECFGAEFGLYSGQSLTGVAEFELAQAAARGWA